MMDACDQSSCCQVSEQKWAKEAKRIARANAKEAENAITIAKAKAAKEQEQAKEAEEALKIAGSEQRRPRKPSRLAR